MRVFLVGGDIEGGLLGEDMGCCLLLVDAAGRQKDGFGEGGDGCFFDDV